MFKCVGTLQVFFVVKVFLFSLLACFTEVSYMETIQHAVKLHLQNGNVSPTFIAQDILVAV